MCNVLETETSREQDLVDGYKLIEGCTKVLTVI